jgi:hypothetical protein
MFSVRYDLIFKNLSKELLSIKVYLKKSVTYAPSRRFCSHEY